MSKNPCDLLDLPDVPEKEVAIYSAQEVSALLYHSIKYDLQNYFALGFFAGLRPEREGLHLKREDFFLETKQIFVPERLGKSCSRSVDIQPVLMKWMTEYLPNEDPVTEDTGDSATREALWNMVTATLSCEAVPVT